MALTHLASEAADDFDRICSVLGTPSLSRELFGMVLNGCDLLESTSDSDGDELFDRLLGMCVEAERIAAKASSAKALQFSPSKALEAGQLDGKALRCLYAYHPTYVACDNPMDTALALTGYLKDLFDSSISKDAKSLAEETQGTESQISFDSSSEKSGSDAPESERRPSINRTGLVELLGRLSEGSSIELGSAADELMSSHLDEVFSQLSLAEPEKKDIEEEELDLEMVAASLLRYNPTSANMEDEIDPRALFHGKVPNYVYDPFHCTPSAFVDALDGVVLDHDAINHHVLNSLAMGSWGGLSGTVRRVADFMVAYRHFTSTFCTHLEETMKMVGEADPSGHFLEVLEENMEEEQGIYEEDDIEMIISLGLDAEKLKNVPHKELYVQCCEGLRQLSHEIGSDEENSQERLTEAQCRHIAAPLVAAFDAACKPSKGATAATAISAMYLGSELIVATLYSKITGYLATLAEKDENCPVTKQHLAFFLLHIDMDVDHAEKMREIVVGLAVDEATRLKMASAVDIVLNARVEFCDRFVEAIFLPTGHGGEDCAKLYNKQSQNWVRKGATCLSDFTGRPVVFDTCSPFVARAHVLDVGCGEGYGARKLVEMGAKRVVGIDVSGEMIERAKTNPNKSTREIYETCDAAKIMEKLKESPTSLGLVPGRLLNEGCFDMAIAIFLFNYTSINKMKGICEQVYQTLKPGGHFIFSVPHPFMLNAHGSKEGSDDDTFTFAKGDAKSDAYFSLRDRKFAGVIRTLDGRDLNVKMLFKTISDYTETMASVGFDISKVHECRVLPEHISHNPEFFGSVKDSPLHIVFDVIKPQSCAKVGRIPKAIAWSPFEKANVNRILPVAIPEAAANDLVEYTIQAYKSGITEETYAPTNEDAKRLSNVASFASIVRARLQSHTGAVHIIGLDMARLSANTDQNGTTDRAKLAYYILSSLIGKVDGSSRGRLFDVIDKGLDTSADNVLFSVSSAHAPFHTDGASADKAYDVVGLLCINPAPEGGKLHLSNAWAALIALKQNIPKFILHELLRPLPRDVLENGSGQGVGNADLLRFSRNPNLLKLRVRHNSYPIFEQAAGDSVRFRYMRQWIESGHKKGEVTISPLLKVALDALDSTLETEKVASVGLKSGEMIFCNNMSFCHARDAFVNKDGDPVRHNVRVWLQLHEDSSQEVDSYLNPDCKAN